MASIASTGAGDARPACFSRPSPPRRVCPLGGHQEAGPPDAAAVEAMLAIALPNLRCNRVTGNVSFSKGDFPEQDSKLNSVLQYTLPLEKDTLPSDPLHSIIWMRYGILPSYRLTFINSSAWTWPQEGSRLTRWRLFGL